MNEPDRTTTTQQKQVFVSFASADVELAHRAVDALERAGIRCWIADRDITTGASYPAAITAAIKGSGAFLLLLTDASNASPHVLREVELAFSSRRPRLPVCIAGTKPSSDLQYFLSTSQWLDAGKTFDEADLAKIEPVLRDLLERGKSDGFGHGDSRRWIWIAASIVLLVTVATLAMIWFNRAPDTTTTTVAARSPQPSTPATTTAPHRISVRGGSNAVTSSGPGVRAVSQCPAV